MESFGGAHFTGVGFTVKKKRSSLSRRPCSDSQKFSHIYTFFPPSTQPLGSGCNEEDCCFREITVGSAGLKRENRLKKLTLKLGGVTHTIHAKSAAEYAFNGGPSIPKPSQCFDVPQPRDKLLIQDSSFGRGNSLRGKTSGESVLVNDTYNYEPVRRSKRVTKKRVMDVGFGEDGAVYAGEEICYLGKHNASRISADYEDEKHVRRETKRGMLDIDMENYGPSKPGKDGRKKSRSEKFYEDKDYVEEEVTSDDEPGYKGKKLGCIEERNELAPQPVKDVFLRSGAGLIEFPDGLPPAPPKKQKAKLSEVEMQLKKAEALQRRRMQSEKAAREAEAEAIRKILGQDSGRKKKEEKIKKQRDESAQGKAGKTETLASNTIRWINGPTGTVVVFSDDIGLPSIFNSVRCSYPPPREKCAGPNCTNDYKYRDSKSKLPLCSLQCYRAIHGKIQSLITC